jgi:hypothetical protein
MQDAGKNCLAKEAEQPLYGQHEDDQFKQEGPFPTILPTPVSKV